MTDRVAIRQRPTGVPGLDQILGGSLPEFSFNVMAGAPGPEKTTLAQPLMFALAGPAYRTRPKAMFAGALAMARPLGTLQASLTLNSKGAARRRTAVSARG